VYTILAYPLDSLDSRPRWNKALITGVSERSSSSIDLARVSIAGACEPVDELYTKPLEVTQNVDPFGRCMFLNLDCDDVTNGRLAILWVSLLRTCKRAT
jgi:hypothetical protein